MKFQLNEAGISEILEIKNCYFLTLIFVERWEKLSVKTACDVNVGQVKKRGKFKTVFFESTWRRNFGRPISAPDRIPDRFYDMEWNMYGISAAKSQTFLLEKRSLWRRARRNGCFM